MTRKGESFLDAAIEGLLMALSVICLIVMLGMAAVLTWQVGGPAGVALFAVVILGILAAVVAYAYNRSAP